MTEWIIPLVSLIVGLTSGLVGTYVGMRLGLAKLEFHMEHVQERLEVLGKRSHIHNEDLLIHDIELEDVMRSLQLPRKKRQSWRFET